MRESRLVENYGVRVGESSPSGNLDLRCFEDPDEKFVEQVNSVPNPSHAIKKLIWRDRL